MPQISTCALLLVPLHHLAQVLVEVVGVVGERGGAVHRRSVRDDEEDAPLLRAAEQAFAGPVDRLAVDAFAEQVGLEQRRDAGPGPAPGEIEGLEDDVAALVEPPRRCRPAGPQPVAPGPAAVPGAGREAEDLCRGAGLLERARQDVEQDRDRLDVRLHRPGAIDQEGEGTVGDRLDAFGAEEPPLGRRGHQLAEAAAVDAALFLRPVPAVDAWAWRAARAARAPASPG